MAVWQSCDVQSLVLVDTVESAPVAIESGSANLRNGLFHGVQIRVSSADVANTTVISRAYSDVGLTQLLYEVSFDLSVANVGTEVQDVSTLTSPVAFYETPFFSLKAPKGGVGRTFTVTYMVEVFH
jgi:hypothetical protein